MRIWFCEGVYVGIQCIEIVDMVGLRDVGKIGGILDEKVVEFLRCMFVDT